jgi:hypothetical protein
LFNLSTTNMARQITLFLVLILLISCRQEKQSDIIFAGQLHAQTVILKIIPQSIIVKDDTLFFKYRVCNKTNQSLLFYNLNKNMGFDVLEGRKNGANLRNVYPGLSVCVFDKNGRLPQTYKSHTIPFEPPSLIPEHKPENKEVKTLFDEFNISILPKAYKRQTEPFENPLMLKKKEVKHTPDGSTIWILAPDDSIEVDLKLSIYPISLKKGQYKLSIYYTSYNFYNKEYYKRKKVDPDLKNTHQFKGVLNSNVCKFNLKR